MGSHTSTQPHGAAAGRARGLPGPPGHDWTPVPVLVQWMATARCEMSCPHCLSCTGEEQPPEMPLEAALRLVDEIADAGVSEFLVTGGEPLGREDLPEVIERLGARGQAWSLNTARMPSGPVRRALERRPPSFVAVSLDGPARIHDAFRGLAGAFDESIEAIRFFSRLGSRVVAGTTVTSFNFRTLPETLATVARSGAASWGLHLVFPEGRARARPDLFLDRRRLRRLFRFVAEKRSHFRVSLADEIGYCGDAEPLVRDAPLACGAGRFQCVVLPWGEVVPCTTYDRATSAGSLRERPLLDIWRTGFAELRARRPSGRCASCELFAACSGGCWLQSRRGTGCHRDVWEPKRPLATAAGLAVALGLFRAPAAASDPVRPEAESPPARASSAGSDVADGIESVIARWYGRTMPDPEGRPHRAGTLEPEPAAADEHAGDPAWSFVASFTSGDLPGDIAGRAEAVRECLETGQKSLALAALLWRSLSECLLDGPSPEAGTRTGEERVAIRETLAALRSAAESWRREVFERRLDPYLARNRRFHVYAFEMSKALIRPPNWVTLARDTAEERWGGRDRRAEAVEGWLERHRWAEGLELAVAGSEDPDLRIASGNGTNDVAEGTVLGIYDVLLVPPRDAAVAITVQWRDSEPVPVRLPSGAEITYADLLRIAWEQRDSNDAGLGETADDVLAPEGGGIPADRTMNPLLLQGIRGRADSTAAGWWLADFWTF